MPSIPFVLSVVAPLVAAVIRVLAPEDAGAAINLVWLLGMMPVFLATRYLGWKGALYGLGWAVLPVLLTAFALSLRSGTPVDMTALGAVVATLAAAALGAGILTESFEKEAAARARSSPVVQAEQHLEMLPGREALDFFLEKLFAGARRSPPLSVALFEVADLADHVELEGAGVVEPALAAVAAALGSETRAMNVLARYDEETFLVLMQGEDVAGAYAFARRVLKEVESRPAPWEGRLHLNAGIATFEDEIREPRELTRRAERALAAARSLGGSAAVVFGGAHAHALGVSGMFILHPDGELREVHRTI